MLLRSYKIYIAMIVVDAHCDTISKIKDKEGTLYSNSFHVDIERMLAAGLRVCCFAAFIDPSYGQAYSMKRAVQLIDEFYQQVEINNEYIRICRNYGEIMRTLKMGKIAAILAIEGGEALQGDLASLRIFYRLGVRSICLTWNYRNEIADGVLDGVTEGGLTPFGKEVVREMNSLNMIIDLSHISERGFWDVLKLTKQPVIVSHSNARSVCNHVRNLSDEQIKAIKTNGGVIGINFYPYFLTDTGKATLKDIINHIEHIAGLIGMDHIGIGSDFDGIECTPEGIRGVEDINLVFNELLRLNYSMESVEKLAGRNFLRIMERVMG